MKLDLYYVHTILPTNEFEFTVGENGAQEITIEDDKFLSVLTHASADGKIFKMKTNIRLHDAILLTYVLFEDYEKGNL